MSTTPDHNLRGPVARHTKLRRPNPGLGVLKWLGLALSAVLVAVVGVGAYAYTDYTGTLSANSITLDGQDTDPPAVDVLPNEDYNILIAGIDKCEEKYLEYFGGRCTEAMVEEQANSYASQLNDVNMIIHISAEPRRVTVISIPRDTMASRPSCTDADGNATSAVDLAAFNESYGTGGLSCVVSTAEQLTGLEIDHAALMTWAGVIDVTNAIGGVTVCVEDGIYDPDNTGLMLDPGTYDLAGETALQFLRVRHGIGDGSDLSRISNQQVYMSALVNKLVSDDTLSDYGALLRLANAVVNNVTVSSGLSNPLTLVQIAGALSSVSLSDYAFIQLPVVDYAPNPNKVAIDQTSWDQVKAALDANQPITFDDPSATETPAPADPTAEPTPEATDPSTVTLPSNLSGSTADQQTATCGTQSLF
ncbi:LCP family protein [Microbacterium indicum]|uniref:LCP family protein n=1 Tax=Microbacterium indicum TaxID=358100 RepID=UPI000426861F|nr:LCP family protein [Microbacterium indicum]